MRNFTITPSDISVERELKDKIDNLTKPKGSLGLLEELAVKIGMIQSSLWPKLNNPYNVIFAADHGVAVEGVSASPQEVTHQMIRNFIEGGAGVNFLANQHNFKLLVVDGGVNANLDSVSGVIDRKIAMGTNNYLYGAAMTQDQMERAIEVGSEVVDMCFENGCNIISFGEMGIANTSASALWMNYLTGIPLERCVGAGSGLCSKGIEHKYNVLSKSKERYSGDGSVYDIMRYFGGIEMVMAVGGMLRAAERKMVIIVDGFIMSSCILAASQIDGNVMDYAIFGHKGDEAGHKLLIDFMKVKPILDLGLRLGEGTGAICAYPIIDSAVRMVNEMSSFEKVQVTKYF